MLVVAWNASQRGSNPQATVQLCERANWTACGSPEARVGGTMIRVQGPRIMGSLARALVAVCAVVLSAAATISAADAQFCTRPADCPDDFQCTSFFFELGTCTLARRNADTDCVGTARPSVCAFGLCQPSCRTNRGCLPGQVCGLIEGRRVCFVPAPPPPAPGPSAPTPGIPLSGEGQACGPRNLGGVIKTIPCKSGSQCINGFCERLR
jgi:hypothetical protein